MAKKEKVKEEEKTTTTASTTESKKAEGKKAKATKKDTVEAKTEETTPKTDKPALKKAKDMPAAPAVPEVQLTGRRVQCFVSKREIDEALAVEVPYQKGEKVWVTQTLVKIQKTHA